MSTFSGAAPGTGTDGPEPACTRIADSRMRKRTTIRTVVSQKRERRSGASSTVSSESRSRRRPLAPTLSPGGEREERRTVTAPSYPILLISVNIGRYIAMTMPPMMTPRMKIMTGSSSLTRPATAMSTSSS